MNRAVDLVGQASVAAFLIALPLLSVAVDGIGGHDFARFAQIILGVMCSSALALGPRHARPNLSIRSRIALASILLLAIASTLRSADLTMATRELGVFASMLAIALVVARIGDPIIVPSKVATVASAAYIAVVLLVVGLTYVAGSRLNRAELFVGYDSYRFFNHVQTVALPLTVLAVTVAPRHGWLRNLARFAAVGGFALLFAMVGRGTLVGIAAGAVAIVAVFGRSSFATLKNLTRDALLGFVLFLIVFWLLPFLLGFKPELSDRHYGARLASDESRFFLWGIALSYVEQHAWFGIGPMHFAHFANLKAAHPHNVYLQIAAEWGMPMLVLVLGVGASALYRLVGAVRHCADTTQRDCGVGLVLTCVAIAVDGLFSGNFVMPISQVWIAFTFGWAMAWMAKQREPETDLNLGMSNLPRRGRFWPIALLALQIWVVWSIWPEFRNIDNHVKQAMERVPNPAMNPRFWSHGWF